MLITGNLLRDFTQAALRIIKGWCSTYEVSVKPTKTELVMFTDKRILGKYLPNTQTYRKKYRLQTSHTEIIYNIVKDEPLLGTAVDRIH